MKTVHIQNNPIEYGQPAFRAILYALFLAGFAIFSSLYCVQPMMPLLADFFQVSPTQSSFPLSFSTLALAFGLLVTGFISDRFGRKPIMVLALLSVAVLLIASAWIQHWSLFLVLRALVGIAVSGVAAVAMTYIAEEIAQKDVGFAMGLYISGTAIGGMSGRLIAGVLVDFVSWQMATLCIGALNLFIAIMFYFMLPNSQNFNSYPLQFRRLKNAFQQHCADLKLRGLFIQGFILMGCLVSIFNYMSYHLLDAPFHLSQVWIGILSVTYLAGIYSSPRSAQWNARFGRQRVLPAMLLMMLLGVILMLSTSLPVLCVGLVLFSFAFFAAHATVSSWVAVHAVEYRAVASSLYLFSYYMGSSVLGSGSGVVWEYSGWSGLIGFIAVILSFGLLIALQQQRRDKA